MPNDLLIQNVRPMGGPAADVLIRNGLIDRIGPDLTATVAGIETIEGDNCLLIPGFVEGHIHLDKTLLGLPWASRLESPSIREKIDNEKILRRGMQVSVEEQAGKLIRLGISQGTSHIRSHVDIDPDLGLSHLEGVMAAREHCKDAVSIQLVAFPQSGVMRLPGTAELIEEAVKAGADLVGGIDPAGIDGDAVGQLNATFAIAERHGVGLDIHLHDPGVLGLYQIGLIAERTRAHGFAGKVAISHAHCLGMIDDAQVGHAVELLAESGISVMTIGAAYRPSLPLKALRDAGVLTFSGSDDVRDAWQPFGNADMLERAMLVAYQCAFTTDEGLELTFAMATRGGARAMGLEGYGLEAGCAADMVLLDGETLAEIVVARPPRKVVVKSGRVVARDGELVV